MKSLADIRTLILDTYGGGMKDSRQDLSRESGIPEGSIEVALYGGSGLSLERVKLVADLLNEPVEELLLLASRTVRESYMAGKEEGNV